MSKFLNKSLVTAISSLCAISTCIDATKVDVYISQEDAREDAKKFRERIRDQIPRYKKGERSYVNQNTSGTFTNVFDTIIDAISTISFPVLSGMFAYGLGNGFGFGDSGKTLMGLSSGIFAAIFSVGNTYRNWKRRRDETENLKTEYCMAIAEETKVTAKYTQTMERAKDTGALFIG